mmetsp:Transcript_29617/g.60781  ORF Transcript_29617/g.60781 Transcript_29617/m.60781 type:complete len:208 (+) Transcript_29617:1405-2028(+)
MPRGVPFSMLLKCPSSTRCTTWLMSGTKNTSNFLRSPSCTRQSSTVLQQHACTSTTLCSKASTISCLIFDSQSRSGGNGWEIQRCTHMIRMEPSNTKRGRALYLRLEPSSPSNHLNLQTQSTTVCKHHQNTYSGRAHYLPVRRNRRLRTMKQGRALERTSNKNHRPSPPTLRESIISKQICSGRALITRHHQRSGHRERNMAPTNGI